MSNIRTYIQKIKDEIEVYNHVRDTMTHLVADLVVSTENLLDDLEAGKSEKPINPAKTECLLWCV